MFSELKKFTCILAGVFLLNFWLPAQHTDSSLFNIAVTLQETNQPVSDLLETITSRAGIYFSYDATAIVADRKVSLDVLNQPVIKVLSGMFDTLLIRFTEKENHIVISLRETDSTRITGPKGEFIKLTGRLMDEKSGEFLPSATVSLFNQPIGTITNAEGEFVLKIRKEHAGEPLVLSCLGYAQKITTVEELQKKDTIALHPISIRIREVKVVAIPVSEILDRVIERIPVNYGNNLLMMRGFYRETLQQDETYINISEAVIDLLKSGYSNMGRSDKVRIVKGRKSPDVSPFQWVNFKLMGGPATMTQLDILKTMSPFIDPEFRNLYTYSIDRVIWYHSRPVYVIRFKPVRKVQFPCYQGEMYIDRETYALLHVDFGFSKQELRTAQQTLIRKKPAGYKVRPERVRYKVDYRYSGGLYYLYAAKASMGVKVKNRKENMNSEFFSVSELLITDLKKSHIKKFPRKELFTLSDIFTESIQNFDDAFWGNFNILKPDENLQTAISNSKNNAHPENKLFFLQQPISDKYRIKKQ